MIYENKNGLNVAKEGVVFIPSENKAHFVKDGFVKCNENLNHKAWGELPKEYEKCDKCFGDGKDSVQLELF